MDKIQDKEHAISQLSENPHVVCLLSASVPEEPIQKSLSRSNVLQYKFYISIPIQIWL